MPGSTHACAPQFSIRYRKLSKNDGLDAWTNLVVTYRVDEALRSAITHLDWVILSRSCIISRLRFAMHCLYIRTCRFNRPHGRYCESYLTISMTSMLNVRVRWYMRVNFCSWFWAGPHGKTSLKEEPTGPGFMMRNDLERKVDPASVKEHMNY